MTRIRQRIFDQKVWMGIDRFSSPHSGCLRFEFLVKMEGKKTLYDWGRSSSRLNQRHSFICLKSRCGETLSQVHQTLEAGIVSSRKYFPLYFNGHQKVIHLFRGRREKKKTEEKLFLNGRILSQGRKKLLWLMTRWKSPRSALILTGRIPIDLFFRPPPHTPFYLK